MNEHFLSEGWKKMKKNLLLTMLIFASFSCIPLSGHAQLVDLLGSITQKLTKSDSNDHKNSNQTKKNTQAAKSRMSCASILNLVKKDDKQYTEDELIKLFGSINASCKSNELNNFKYTSVGTLVGYIENCRTYVSRIQAKDKSIFLYYSEPFQFCAKISSKTDKNIIINHLKTRDKKYDKILEKEYPDAEDRAVMLKKEHNYMVKNDKRWRNGFERDISIQWIPYSGYVIQNVNAIDEEAIIKNLPQNLKCSPTSENGISYCGKISAKASNEFVKTQLPLFKVKNQKFNIIVVEDPANHKLVYQAINRQLRNVILELGLDPYNRATFAIDKQLLVHK